MFDISGFGYGYLGILFITFALNLVPFVSPSNLIVAVDIGLLTTTEPIAIGLIMATAAVSAKLIHYYFMYFVRRVLKEERRVRLERYGSRLGRWGFLAVFVAATTPVPDDPVIIPLGLIRYNPVKLCLSYFSGKLVITTVGGYLGRLGGLTIGPMLGDVTLIAISLAITVGVTVTLMKVDVDKLWSRVRRRLRR